MKQYEDDTFLARWLNQDLSPEELAAFEQSEDYARLKLLMDASQKLKGPAFDAAAMLEATKAKIKAEQVETTPARTRSLRPLWYGIAASLLIAAVLFGLWQRQGDELPQALALSTGIGEQLTQEFPDGTSIRLNAGTELKARIGRADQVRTVDLKGEAFFDVAKGASFTVSTPTGVVEVLGTSFNVAARDGRLQVNCYEGVVVVEHQGQRDTLRAGEGLRFAINQSIPESISTPVSSPGWTQGFSTFSKLSLQEVVDAFMRQYPVELILQDLDPALEVTASFGHGDLEAALETAFGPLGVEWEIEGTKVVLKAR